MIREDEKWGNRDMDMKWKQIGTGLAVLLAAYGGVNYADNVRKQKEYSSIKGKPAVVQRDTKKASELEKKLFSTEGVACADELKKPDDKLYKIIEQLQPYDSKVEIISQGDEQIIETLQPLLNITSQYNLSSINFAQKRKIAYNYNTLGIHQSRFERYSEAIINYEKAIELENNPTYLSNMGIAYVNLGKKEKERKKFLVALHYYTEVTIHPEVTERLKRRAEKMIKIIKNKYLKRV